MSQNTINCPRCKGYAVRIRRRYIDRLISIFKPVHRYKCQNHICHWAGNVKQGDIENGKINLYQQIEKNEPNFELHV